jgi:hypothetical protein
MFLCPSSSVTCWDCVSCCKCAAGYCPLLVSRFLLLSCCSPLILFDPLFDDSPLFGELACRTQATIRPTSPVLALSWRDMCFVVQKLMYGVYCVAWGAVILDDELLVVAAFIVIMFVVFFLHVAFINKEIVAYQQGNCCLLPHRSKSTFHSCLLKRAKPSASHFMLLLVELCCAGRTCALKEGFNAFWL